MSFHDFVWRGRNGSVNGERNGSANGERNGSVNGERNGSTNASTDSRNTHSDMRVPGLETAYAADAVSFPGTSSSQYLEEPLTFPRACDAKR